MSQCANKLPNWTYHFNANAACRQSMFSSVQYRALMGFVVAVPMIEIHVFFCSCNMVAKTSYEYNVVREVTCEDLSSHDVTVSSEKS